MNSDPNKYAINGEFASSGNDNSVQISLSVPSHSVPSMQDMVYTQSVPAPSKWLGKQIRADIQVNGSLRLPGTYQGAIIPITWSGGSAASYAFIDITRIENGNIQLRARTVNTGSPPGNITFSSFSVVARVRTVIGN